MTTAMLTVYSSTVFRMDAPPTRDVPLVESGSKETYGLKVVEIRADYTMSDHAIQAEPWRQENDE